jgi:pimeloyl-ACP methyl ester carboxylesterase
MKGLATDERSWRRTQAGGASLIRPTPCIAAVFLTLASCASPSAGFDAQAAALGLHRTVVAGAGFRHVLYRNDGAPAAVLHVYIDGDGSPWIAGQPAVDPTPRNALVLRLMAQDPARAVYIGRPCYNGTGTDAACSARLWTTDRYSAAVVASMASVVRQQLAAGGYSAVGWFGHSGGGTLAVLLARAIPRTAWVVTVGAVLDTGIWASAVAHDDLSGSLNPADGAKLPLAIRQRHYAGADDKVVPPALMASPARRLGSDLIVVPNNDHVCCWERAWPDILREAATRDPTEARTASATEAKVAPYQPKVTPTMPP